MQSTFAPGFETVELAFRNPDLTRLIFYGA